MLLNEEDKEEYCQDISEDYDFLRADHYDSLKVHVDPVPLKEKIANPIGPRKFLLAERNF